jgi:hypothetical protein
METNYTTLIFNITTTDVEAYLQKKLNTIINNMKINNMYNGEDMTVSVISHEIKPPLSVCNIHAFTILLPLTAIKDYHNYDNLIDEFNLKNDSNVILYEPITTIFKSYMYTNDDEEVFNHNYRSRYKLIDYNDDVYDNNLFKIIIKKLISFIHKLKLFKNNEVDRHNDVNTQSCRNTYRHPFMKYRHPRKIRLNNLDKEFVLFLIDPIKIFYDMLMDGSSIRYSISIDSFSKIQTGNYEYTIKRTIKSKNKP